MNKIFFNNTLERLTKFNSFNNDTNILSSLKSPQTTSKGAGLFNISFQALMFLMRDTSIETVFFLWLFNINFLAIITC